MNLYEFFTSQVDIPEPYQNREEDSSQVKMSDSRKTKLTLRQIHQLRRMTDVRDVEKKNEVTRLNTMYGAKPEQPEF